MARKGRKLTKLAIGLITVLLAGGYGAVGYAYYQERATQDGARTRIAELQSEKTSLEREIEETEAQIVEKDAQIENLRNTNEQLPYSKDEYYCLCKQLEDKVLAGESPHKIAYLTFDDGPYTETTGQYLDVLEQYDVRATFFQLGKTSEKYDGLYRRAYENGNTIANHTYSHQIKNGIYRGVDYFIADVVRNREFIENKLGYTTNILRFPGGTATAGSLYEGITQQLRELGYGWVDWNAATGDGVVMLSPAEYRDNVLNDTKDRNVLVVLMHDYNRNTLVALPEIIEGLRAQGYVLLPLFYESAMVNK